MKAGLALFPLFLLAEASGAAHRLDECLQATILSIDRTRVNVEMTLTPGVSALPAVLAAVGANGDGEISKGAEQAYAARVLRDLSLKLDAQNLAPRLVSVQFPEMAEMKAGRGGIQILFFAELPAGAADRKLTFENHHLSGISAYQVNALVPRDPAIQILSQNRNYLQSIYEMEFAQPGFASDTSGPAWMPRSAKWLGIMAILLLGWFASVKTSRFKNPE